MYTGSSILCNFYKIKIKTKVWWWPSWISRWPPELQFWKCSYWIAWPWKCIFRHTNCVSIISKGWDIGKHGYRGPQIWWHFRHRVPSQNSDFEREPMGCHHGSRTFWNQHIPEHHRATFHALVRIWTIWPQIVTKELHYYGEG